MAAQPLTTALELMIKSLVRLALIAFGLVPAGLVAEPVEQTWHPSESGCFERTLHESLRHWSTLPLSVGSYRFSVLPDSRGPIIAVAFDSGSSPVSAPERVPMVIGAVGDMSRTCVVRVPAKDCPGAASALKGLSELELPVRFEVAPDLKLRLHPVKYSVEVIDSYGLRNRWSSFSGGPLHAPVESAVSELSGCLEAASTALGAEL